MESDCGGDSRRIPRGAGVDIEYTGTRDEEACLLTLLAL